MSDLRDKQVEFASPPWLELLERLLLAAAALNSSSVSGVTCEVYRNVPRHLAAEGRLAWTRRMRNGSVEIAFEECPDDEADIKLVADYEALLPLVRFVITDESEPDFSRLMQAEVVAGRIEIVRERRPEGFKRDYTVHNLVAVLTR